MATQYAAKKALEEEIVRRFLRVAGIRNCPDSVCGAKPPCPDVLCRFANGEKVAFELTEAVDPKVVRNVKSSDAARRRMYEYHEQMESSDRAKLDKALGDAHVSIHYANDMTETRFTKLLPRLFCLLLDLLPESEGKLERGSLPDGIERINITRGMNGPLFNPRGPALYVRETTVSRIEAKFAKQYECDCPIELVVHSKTKPLPPDQLWRGEVHRLVPGKIAESPFRRVWIFDYVQSVVKYVYPADGS
jgi:hypothetical protein